METMQAYLPIHFYVRDILHERKKNNRGGQLLGINKIFSILKTAPFTIPCVSYSAEVRKKRDRKSLNFLFKNIEDNNKSTLHP